MSKLLKVSSIVIAILGFIGSIIMANVPVYGEIEFSFTLFLTYFVSVLIICTIMFALALILERVDQIVMQNYNISKDIKRILEISNNKEK